MTRTISKLTAATLAAAAILAIAAGAASASEVVYNNIPSPLPGNLASVGNEAYSMSEIGGQVEFQGTARKNPTIVVAMSSWACQEGTWSAHNCITAPGAKYAVPVTFSVYAVGPEDAVGAKLATGSKTFKMPYRPSANNKKKCVAGSGKWYQASSKTCFNGKAFKITLPLKVAHLPEQVIVSVSYNTTHDGYAPIGETACNSEEQGCFYDSLNVGLTEPSEGGATIGKIPRKPSISTRPTLKCSAKVGPQARSLPRRAKGSGKATSPRSKSRPAFRVRAQAGPEFARSVR